MLKKVVLPAPLGPMIETIDFGAIVNVHVVHGHEAAEDLRDVLSGRAASWPSPFAVACHARAS